MVTPLSSVIESMKLQLGYLQELREETGRSEKGRHLSIAITDLETVILRAEKAESTEDQR